MSFINFLNYKKYIGRSTDAQAARIGHVNAVYDALLLQLEDPIETATVDTTIGNSIEVTSKRILLTVIDNVSSIPTTYSITQPDITPNSIIKITLVELADDSGAPVIRGYALSLVAFELQTGSANLILSVGDSLEITPDDTVKFFIEIINQ
jgi:hypothetical protein